MSDSDDNRVPDSDVVSWAADFHNLATELKISYQVVYERCEPGSMHLWRANLKILKYKTVGFGHSQNQAKDAACRNAFPWLRLQSEGVLREKRRSSQFGAVRLEIGKKNEREVLEALTDPRMPKPGWFKSARSATEEEDSRGIDIVVETNDIGYLYLQVKSSEAHARRFKERRRSSMINVIIIRQEDELRDVNRRALELLNELRGKILQRRNSSCA